MALFNSISSLINQMLSPYDFSETDAGIAGGLLIVVGLIVSAITSPIIDKTKSYLFTIKVCVPITAICYLVFVWVPPTRSVAAVCAVLSVLGAASFSLVPVVLEYLCEITYPVSPEVTSTICWAGGQLVGAIAIVVSDALREGEGEPPGTMRKALWFQAILAMAVVPLPLALGCCGRRVRSLRVEADDLSRADRDVENGGAGVVVLP